METVFHTSQLNKQEQKLLKKINKILYIYIKKGSSLEIATAVEKQFMCHECNVIVNKDRYVQKFTISHTNLLMAVLDCVLVYEVCFMNCYKDSWIPVLGVILPRKQKVVIIQGKQRRIFILNLNIHSKVCHILIDFLMKIKGEKKYNKQ